MVAVEVDRHAGARRRDERLEVFGEDSLATCAASARTGRRSPQECRVLGQRGERAEPDPRGVRCDAVHYLTGWPVEPRIPALGCNSRNVRAAQGHVLRSQTVGRIRQGIEEEGLVDQRMVDEGCRPGSQRRHLAVNLLGRPRALRRVRSVDARSVSRQNCLICAHAPSAEARVCSSWRARYAADLCDVGRRGTSAERASCAGPEGPLPLRRCSWFRCERGSRCPRRDDPDGCWHANPRRPVVGRERGGDAVCGSGSNLGRRRREHSTKGSVVERELNRGLKWEAATNSDVHLMSRQVNVGVPRSAQHREYTVGIGEAEGPGLSRTSERRRFDNVGNRRDGNCHPRVRRQRLPDHHRDPSSELQGAAKMRKGRQRFVEEHHPEAGEQHVGTRGLGKTTPRRRRVIPLTVLTERPSLTRHGSLGAKPQPDPPAEVPTSPLGSSFFSAQPASPQRTAPPA